MRAFPAALAIALALPMAGCESGMHDMYDQAKYRPLEPSPLFADGNSSRPPVAGTVPYSAGATAGASSGRLGAVEAATPAGPVTPIGADGRSLVQPDAQATRGYASPLPSTPTLLARGRQRFGIFCAPCHGAAGDGNGMIAMRGFPHPPTYHDDRLRRAPDSHFYQVITHGYGAMFPYADRIDAHDRWAIVAYIRALQLSQHAPHDALEVQDLDRLRTSAESRSSSGAAPKGKR